ncbi:MAG: hypothetical protein HC904_08670 [Blastochloris sp.]|nr:hypothetical protein [Blastochloris sp.]
MMVGCSVSGVDAASPEPWHFVPPAGSGVVNVKDYGAKGDGVTDDTAAINKAISDNIDKSRYRCNPMIWLPKGTYLVTGPIESRVVAEGREEGKVWSAGWRSMLLLIGESREETVIKLADRAPGYTDPAKGKWVIATGSEGDKRDNFRGGGNRAFRHAILNLTVDVGEGNPGAKAIDFCSNNRGTVSGVTVRAAKGSGHTGIDLTRAWPGPAMILDVKIEGFARGIALTHYQYGMTFENIQMSGQEKIGISNDNNVLAMRKIQFEGSVPFYSGTGGHGMLTLVDSSITGSGTSDQAAMSSAGFVNLRRVNVTGFGSVLDDTRKENKDVAMQGGTTQIESHDQGFTISGSGGKPEWLNLPIEDIPVMRAPADATWVDAGETLASFQAVIDSGAEYIYVKPIKEIKMEDSLVLRGKVKWILGLSGHITSPQGKPAVRVENGESPVVVMEQMYLQGGVDQVSDRTFVLKHGDVDSYGVKATGSGKTHIIDVIGRGYDIGPRHSFWARQLNAEFGEEPLLTNSGTSWILGFKMETSPRGSKDSPNSTPSLRNKEGKLEVMAGLLYTLGNSAAQAPLVPAFTNERGTLAVSFRNNGIPATYYRTILRRGGWESGEDMPLSEIKGPGAALLMDQR